MLITIIIKLYDIVNNFTDVPSSPQRLMRKILESGSDYITIKMIWEPPNPDIDSRVDFYHFQVYDDMIKANATVILDSNTTNTTDIIMIDNEIGTALFVLSAYNCNGASTPVELVISTGENELCHNNLHICVILIFNA